MDKRLCKYAENPTGDVWECMGHGKITCPDKLYDRNPDGSINIIKCMLYNDETEE